VTVVFTSRKEDDGKKALDALNNAGIKNVAWHQLDQSDDKSIETLVAHLIKNYGSVDWVINNAGKFSDYGTPVLQSNFDNIDSNYRTNTLGPLKILIGLVPAMKNNNYGRVVNVSSGAGQLSEMNGKNVGYRMSKASLNVITKVFADELKSFNILVNSVCPGFVKTDMTGGENSKATKTPEEAADTIVWLASLEDDGPRGGFFRNRKPLAF